MNFFLFCYDSLKVFRKGICAVKWKLQCFCVSQRCKSSNFYTTACEFKEEDITEEFIFTNSHIFVSIEYAVLQIRNLVVDYLIHVYMHIRSIFGRLVVTSTRNLPNRTTVPSVK